MVTAVLKRAYMVVGLLVYLIMAVPHGGSAQHEGDATQHGRREQRHEEHEPQRGEPGHDVQERTDYSGPALTLSERAQRLAEIQTTEVKRMAVAKQVRLVGKIDYDETRIKYITAWVPGRLDRLYVDYTGVSVKKGDHMVLLYSPELFSAQEELIQAMKGLNRLSSSANTTVRESSVQSVKAAREKLRLLGLTEGQVRQIEEEGRASEQMTIYAPMGGVVVEKHVGEGVYVETGTQIYTIADLSHLWIYLAAYESDLPWIHYGQEVALTAQALPGERFSGIVSFVQPFLDEKTRTARVRVNVDNRSGLLKPGGFVTAVIHVSVSSAGHVVGRPYRNAELPLVIPASAPLITGRRAVVYVKERGTSRYEGREVVLGPRAGEYYLVNSGLQEGELVVTNGAFKIDADLQIQGRPSMMSPEGTASSGGHAGHGGH